MSQEQDKDAAQFLALSPVPAASLLSGPGSSAEEGWQGPLQMRKLLRHVGLSRDPPGVAEVAGGEKGGEGK